jgi:hypothetical protein
MPKIEIARVYEVKLPVALMPRADVGQIGFSADGQSFSILMSRDDFERLGRKIARLLAETPPPSPTPGATLQTRKKSGKET